MAYGSKDMAAAVANIVLGNLYVFSIRFTTGVDVAQWLASISK